MKRLVMITGWILLALGTSCADSECLIVPIVMVITGAFLMYFGSKENIKM